MLIGSMLCADGHRVDEIHSQSPAADGPDGADPMMSLDFESHTTTLNPSSPAPSILYHDRPEMDHPILSTVVRR